MGAWGFYEYPTEPPSRDIWEEMEEWADIDSQQEFIEREMSYADAMAEVEEIATDEGGWGAWMDGER